MSSGQNIKRQDRSNIVINSIKTLKMVHIKNNIKKIKMGKLSLLNALGFTQGHKLADGPIGMGNMGLWTFT